MVCLLLLLAASSLVFTGVAGMSLFGPQSFTADDNGKSVTVNNGETFWIKLPENPTTGYAWDLMLSDGLTKLSDKYEPADRSGLKVGVGGTHSYEIKAMKNGSQRVTGTYRQAGNQSSDGQETYSLNVNVVEGGPLSGHPSPDIACHRQRVNRVERTARQRRQDAHPARRQQEYRAHQYSDDEPARFSDYANRDVRTAFSGGHLQWAAGHSTELQGRPSR